MPDIHNFSEGSIPDELRQLKALSFAWLYGNEFSGERCTSMAKGVDDASAGLVSLVGYRYTNWLQYLVPAFAACGRLAVPAVVTCLYHVVLSVHDSLVSVHHIAALWECQPCMAFCTWLLNSKLAMLVPLPVTRVLEIVVSSYFEVCGRHRLRSKSSQALDYVAHTSVGRPREGEMDVSERRRKDTHKIKVILQQNALFPHPVMVSIVLSMLTGTKAEVVRLLPDGCTVHWRRHGD